MIAPPSPPTAAKGPLEEIGHVPIHPWFRPLAFSPDNERVAIDNGWNIKLVELETGKLMGDIAPGPPLFGNGNAVTSAAITPDGNIIASYEDQVIRVWDRTAPGRSVSSGQGPRVNGSGTSITPSRGDGSSAEAKARSGSGTLRPARYSTASPSGTRSWESTCTRREDC